MIRWCLFLVSFGLLLGSSYPYGLGEEHPEYISIIELVSNGERFDSWLIRVEGFLWNGDLYTSKDDAARSDYRSAIELRIDNARNVVTPESIDKLQAKFVVVYGRYHDIKRTKGKVGVVRVMDPRYAGYIDEIAQIEELEVYDFDSFESWKP